MSLFVFAIFFLFWLLHYFQIFIQGVEAGIPDLPVFLADFFSKKV